MRGMGLGGVGIIRARILIYEGNGNIDGKGKAGG